MAENITNRSDLEEASRARLIEQPEYQPKTKALEPDELVDESPLPKGMRERVETVEVSTLKPRS